VRLGLPAHFPPLRAFAGNSLDTSTGTQLRAAVIARHLGGGGWKWMNGLVISWWWRRLTGRQMGTTVVFTD
jgi:hypothetical protein